MTTTGSFGAAILKSGKMLTEKYKPKTLGEIIGQNKTVEMLKEWYEKWKPGNKCLFLHGQPGIGKTCIIETFASDNNIELVDMNASDHRTSEQIEKIAGHASVQSSLSGKKKMILVDEVDNLAREESVTPLVHLIKNSKFPIVLTANNAWNLKIRSLHEVSELVPVRRVMVFSIVKKLKSIASEEKLDISEDSLKSIAEQSSGDVRSAINDLESFSAGGLGYRERKASIFDAIRIILKSDNVKDARSSVMLLDEDPEYLFWWVENNVIEEYTEPQDLAKAMQRLALADLFKTRIKKQNWKMLGYFVDITTSGVALAKKEKYRNFVSYRPPEIIMSLGRTKKRRALRKEMCKKIGKAIHESSSTINSEYLPFLRIIAKNSDVAGRFGLSVEEAEILKN